MTTVIERDLSLEEAARLLGYRPSNLRAHWGEIPTAYKTDGGQYRVNPEGLRQWLFERSENANAAGATAASVGR